MNADFGTCDTSGGTARQLRGTVAKYATLLLLRRGKDGSSPPWGGTHLDLWPSRRRGRRAGQSRRNAYLKAEQL
eukprot:1435096-Prymnesium_polylepis.1